MVKKILFIIFLLNSLFANIYEKNCVSCHKIYAPPLKKLFFDYLLRFSSEKRVKKALYEYLKNPTPEKSVMEQNYLKKYGVKEKSKLNDIQLKKAIDIYWDNIKL